MTEEVVKPRKRHRGEAIWAIIWNIFFLWIVNKVPDWNLAFINERYDTILWILNFNIIIQIAGYAMIMFFDYRWSWHLVRTILDAASLVTLLVLYFIYPFDFSTIDVWSWLDIVIPIVFIIGMIASGLGMVFHLVKFIIHLTKVV